MDVPATEAPLPSGSHRGFWPKQKLTKRGFSVRHPAHQYSTLETSLALAPSWCTKNSPTITFGPTSEIYSEKLWQCRRYLDGPASICWSLASPCPSKSFQLCAGEFSSAGPARCKLRFRNMNVFVGSRRPSSSDLGFASVEHRGPGSLASGQTTLRRTCR